MNRQVAWAFLALFAVLLEAGCGSEGAGGTDTTAPPDGSGGESTIVAISIPPRPSSSTTSATFALNPGIETFKLYVWRSDGTGSITKQTVNWDDCTGGCTVEFTLTVDVGYTANVLGVKTFTGGFPGDPTALLYWVGGNSGERLHQVGTADFTVVSGTNSVTVTMRDFDYALLGMPAEGYANGSSPSLSIRVVNPPDDRIMQRLEVRWREMDIVTTFGAGWPLTSESDPPGPPDLSVVGDDLHHDYSLGPSLYAFPDAPEGLLAVEPRLVYAAELFEEYSIISEAQIFSVPLYPPEVGVTIGIE